jgi:serine/threonine protein phosphatase PrpC
VREARGPEERLRTALLDGFELANERVLALGRGAATTLAAVEVVAGTIRTYHVGDSLILVVGGRGRIKWRTVAHSPVGYGLEAGLLDEEDALAHDERHLVSNVLGSTEMRIEIGPPLELAPRDTVLLASDGLADNLHIDDIVAGLRDRDLGRAVVDLADRAGRRMVSTGEAPLPGKPDDLTLVAYRPSP